MKKSKKGNEEPQDRLSELPDSLIFDIFWLLPMRDVVRTTILSKRWENFWTTTPYLNFDCIHKSKFVNRALILWRGFKILRFKFGRGYVHKKSVFGDIDVWVRLCRVNGIEELYLDDICIFNNGATESYCVPQSLYSCSSLKVLSLRGCIFQIDGNVQWNQLRSLTIEGCILDEHSINQLVCGSPQLEVFNLNISDSDENLSIRSSCLKKLSIQKHLRSYRDEPSTGAELKIWSPNLETLDIIGVPYCKCALMNVSSLTHLTLDISYQICEEDIFGEVLWQIFPTIQHVEKLTLSDWCIKVLGAMKDKYSISPSPNLKSLTINKEYAGDYEEIVYILQIFPKLKTLVLQFDPFYQSRANRVGNFFHYERNLPESFLLQLRTVEITLTKVDDLIFPFIEILLKHASNLQKMAIRVRGHKQPLTPSFLAKMPRSSPTAELIVVGH